MDEGPGSSHSGFPPMRSPVHFGQKGSWQNMSGAQEKSLDGYVNLGVMDREVIVDTMGARITKKGDGCGQGERGNG